MTLSRREWIASLPLAAQVTALGAAAARPNVLLIMADDLGYECLGCNGGTSYRTPHLNKLAATGIRFTHAYAQPLCTPTRVQLMTGQHNFRNWRGFGIMDPNEKTFGHSMQSSGYKTAIAGKWQFYSYEDKGSARYARGMKPEQSGFGQYLLWHDLLTEDKGSRYADPVLNENGTPRRDTRGRYGPDLEVEFLTQFMERNRANPFFAYYSMTLTHGPFNPTPRSAVWAHGDRLKDDARHFADMVEYMDHCVGRLLDFLDRAGLAENTLVLFYADNGTPREITSRAGERVLRGGKGLTTDAGMHVPLLARWRGVTSEGKTCHDLIDSTDFVPTIMDACGTRWFKDKPLDGRSFLPQIRGNKGNPRPWAFSHYDPHPGCKVNFTPTRLGWTHRYKLYLDGRLYQIENDPDEQLPVPEGSAPAEARDARRMLQAALDEMARVRPPAFNRFETDGRTAY